LKRGLLPAAPDVQSVAILGRVPVKSDLWSRWLLDRRDAGDAAQRLATLEHLSPVRDRVLEAAGSLDGATLLDVGCGDGLIGLRALDLVGPNGTVIFADISDALIEHCRETVRARGALERARFVLAGGEGLAGIPTASVDVVTTRSVLIYVEDKARAISAMHRVLRPGGRISLFEPINRLMFPEPPDRFGATTSRGQPSSPRRSKRSLTGVSSPEPSPR
jgi:arsenite methyltransferase